MILKQLLSFLLILTSLSLWSQRASWQRISLEDLSAFRQQAGNWSVVGTVQMDPNRSVREKPPMPEQEPQKKKKRRKKRSKDSPTEIDTWVPPITYEPGTGVLLNQNTDSLKDELLTNWEHGDLELEIEVMVPKGSNSGIYFQGRYEIQILDSYGKKDPYFGDMGGIYQKWGGDPNEVYRGKPPFINAAKAPGLWQTFRIGFQAPKFDETGAKISNAKFIYVDLNGVRIHQNAEVPYPTRGAMSNQEVPLGPLRIQGDHGPVAFRNIRYRKLNQRPISTQDITYQVYKGSIKSPEDLKEMEPIMEGSQDQLNSDLPGLKEPFIIVYQGHLKVSEAGTYPLQVACVGNIQLDILGKTYVEYRYKNKWQMAHKADIKLDLPAGATPFTLIYHKAEPRNRQELGLYSLDSYPKPLHSFTSVSPQPKRAAPILLHSLSRVRTMRGFFTFKKGTSHDITHAIAIGNPKGVHYVYDIKTGTPACTWRGDFLDVTPMWNGRGGQAFKPLGAPHYLFTGCSFALLPDSSAPFPQQLERGAGFQYKGYDINPKTGLPVFLYAHDSLEVKDMLVPAEGGNALSRKLSFAHLDSRQGISIKIAEGTHVKSLPDQMYLIDQTYYVKVHTDQPLTIRTTGDSTELVAHNKAKTLHYSIIW